jgi:hypothetical protein
MASGLNVSATPLQLLKHFAECQLRDQRASKEELKSRLRS